LIIDFGADRLIDPGRKTQNAYRNQDKSLKHTMFFLIAYVNVTLIQISLR
jgi:hypothetical protein